jgi:hypothetical protein
MNHAKMSDSSRWLWPGIIGTAVMVSVLAITMRHHPQPLQPSTRPTTSGGNYDELVQQADDLVQRSSYTEATQVLNRAIKADPENPRAHDMLAQIELYVFGQLPAAIQNYQAAAAHGGASTFHVNHDHGGGDFVGGCEGLLSVSKANIKFSGYRDLHGLESSREHVAEIKPNHFTLEEGHADRHAFHVTLDDGKTFNFAPTSQFPEAERDLILKIGGAS